MGNEPLISIIITAYTTERLADILELLDSIKMQDYPRLETVFVAEKSRELLTDIQEYAAQQSNPHMTVLFNDDELGLSTARNLGIGKAKGDIIAFVDDDTVLCDGWAASIATAYQNYTIIGVTGPAIPLWEDESMAWFPEEFYWIFSCTAWSGWNELREVRNAWGMNMSFRRLAFEQCGLFDEACGFHKGVMAEDNEFSLRVKNRTEQKIIYHPEVKLWHRVHKYRLTQRFIMKRAYWIGYTRRMLKRHASENTHRDLLDQENQLLRRIFRRLLPDIAKGFFTHPVIAWRRLLVTINALFFIGAGYCSPMLNPFRHNTKTQKV